MQPHRVYHVFSTDECSAIVQYARSRPSETAEVAAGISRHRRGSVMWLHPNRDTQWLFDRLAVFGIRYARKNGITVTGLHRRIQISEYPRGGRFDWHTDFDGTERPAKKISLVGQLSSSNDYEGGNFEFVGISPSIFDRAQGSVVAFPTTLGHRVTPVRKGKRYTVVAWMNGPAFR